MSTVYRDLQAKYQERFAALTKELVDDMNVALEKEPVADIEVSFDFDMLSNSRWGNGTLEKVAMRDAKVRLTVGIA